MGFLRHGDEHGECLIVILKFYKVTWSHQHFSGFKKRRVFPLNSVSHTLSFL